jgi:TetR/AcrR family transcriptional regulator
MNMLEKTPKLSKKSHPKRSSAREQLLDAASELMNERDSLDISLSDIAERAKVNSALVKYYFNNKQGLMLALLERDVSDGMAQLEKLTHASMPAAEKMKMHIVGLINTYNRCRYLNKLLFALLRTSTPEQAQEISDRFVKPAADAQRVILEEGYRNGEFRKIDPMLLYFTIIGACDQFFTAHFALKTVYNRDGIDDDLRKKFIAHTVSVLMNGIMNEAKPA